MRISRPAFGLLLVFAVAAAPSVSEAQRRPGQGTVRLSLDSEVFGVSVFPDRVNIIGLGLNGRGLGPGIGYAITDDVLIGVRTAFGFLLIDPTSPGDSVSGTISLLPYFEIVFGSEGLIPFVGAQAGFSAIFPDGRDAYANVLAGAYGGLHAMLADNFSLTPFLELNFLYAGGSSILFLGPDERAGFGITLGVSLMGWIGDIAGAVGEATDDGLDTSGPRDGVFTSGGGGGGGGSDSPPPVSGDPESGLE